MVLNLLLMLMIQKLAFDEGELAAEAVGPVDRTFSSR